MKGINHWLEPWDELCTPPESFEKQLYKETGSKHLLYNLEVHAIGRRYDCDEILFEVDSEHFKYAVVHLTYSSSPSLNEHYPMTTIYATIEEFAEKRMKKDHANFD